MYKPQHPNTQELITIEDDAADSNMAQIQTSNLASRVNSKTATLADSIVAFNEKRRVILDVEDGDVDSPQKQGQPIRKRDRKAERLQRADNNIKEDPYLRKQAKLEQDKAELLARLLGKKSGKNPIRSSQMADRYGKALKSEKAFDEESREITINLIEKMHAVCLSDYEAIKRGEAAMSRFKMTEEVSQLLNKKHVQEVFLENHGCRFLEMWLERNPDDSYPPVQVVECVLDVLNRLPIVQEHLESCNIAHMVTLYAAGDSSTDESEIPKYIISAATKLLQKWQTVVYQLSYEYDKDGQHEIKQRDLRRRLEVLRDMEKQALSDSLGLERSKNLVSREDDLIRKTPNGFVFLKQNFDWLEKPQSNIDQGQARCNSFKQSLTAVIKNHRALSTRNSRK